MHIGAELSVNTQNATQPNMQYAIYIGKREGIPTLTHSLMGVPKRTQSSYESLRKKLFL